MIKHKYLLMLLLMLLGMGGTAGAAAKMPAASKLPGQEIPFNTIEGVRTGSVEDNQGKTGVTALLFAPGARGGIDISGGGPASRETPLLNPMTAETPVNALLLSGGSAFGLAASTGAMTYLREHNQGVDTGYAKVPIVCQSCIFDLSYGSNTAYPDAALGYAACVKAEANVPKSGNFGAGTGATVGKFISMKQSMKGGLGFYAGQAGTLKIGAVVVVNAFGDIYDPETGAKIAGLKTPDRQEFLDGPAEFYKNIQPRNLFKGNTTIGAIVTNGDFSKAELNKLASMTRGAYARCIKPVGTMIDGDSIYAFSCGKVKADVNVTGTLAAEVMAQAIAKAIRSSQIPDAEFLPFCR